MLALPSTKLLGGRIQAQSLCRLSDALAYCYCPLKKNSSDPRTLSTEERSRKPKARASNPAVNQRKFLTGGDQSNVQPRRLRPRASNPSANQPRHFFDPDYLRRTREHSEEQLDKGDKDRTTAHAWFKPSSTPPERKTLGEHLHALSDHPRKIPTSTWVQVQGISPISTLNAMLTGIDNALDAEEARGMPDLDARWNVGEAIPWLQPMVAVENRQKWVRKALLILSPFGRPKGWFLQFDNRSIVYALLAHTAETPVLCSYKAVKVSECKEERVEDGVDESLNCNGLTTRPVNNNPDFLINEQVSDHTLRVENCPYFVKSTKLLNFFSRYDLRPKDAVQIWKGRTSNGRTPKNTFLVHFADASWARAALREKQGSFMHRMGEKVVADQRDPLPLRLVQYPKQIL